MDQDVTFGPYRFELRTGRLWSGAEEVRLTPKASAVLRELVTRAATPVSKDELFASVWDGAAVSDDALTTCVQELRRALGDDSRQPRFIETRHRRGYQFIAPLSASVPATPAAVSTIAVLPFADMSAEQNQGYLCDGLADELINALGHVDGLRVSARTASFQFRNAGGNVGEIGRQLGVATLLEGSVRKAGDRLRVTVQLIEAASGYHLWSERFDRRLDDVFAIQDEIAEHVATRLRGGALTAREKEALRRPQVSVDAYEQYLRGRQHLALLARPELEKSAASFRRAIELDPSYGPAFAGLATIHATLYEWFGARAEDLAAAEQASERALSLSPAQAEAHVARGFTLSLLRRYDEAAAAFDAAVALKPNLFDAYYFYARAMFAAGEIAKSAELFQKAAVARHDDFQSPLLLAQSLHMLGNEGEADAASREGATRAEHALALNPRDGRALTMGSIALLAIGDRTRALEWSRRALELYPDDPTILYPAACLRVNAGDTDGALELLERVFARGWGKRDWVEHDPDLDPLRGDPRFQMLLARLK